MNLSPHPPRARHGQVFSGPGFHNGSLTRTNLLHFLACRRQCDDTSFLSNLLHQFVTSLPARVLHRQAIRRPLLSCALRNPWGRHRPISLWWPASFRNASGVSVQTQVQPSRAAPARASLHGIDLSANLGFHRRSGIPQGQRALVAQSRRLPGSGMESAGGSCSLPIRMNESLPSCFSARQIRPPALRCMPRQHC